MKALPLCAGSLRTVGLVGLRFADISMSEVLAVVKAAAEGSRWHYVVTPNAAHLARCASDPSLFQLYQNADLCLLDSRVIGVALRIIGRCCPQVVPGADLVAEMFRTKLLANSKICVIGGDADRIRHLFCAMRMPEPKHINPTIGFWHNTDEIVRVAAFITAAQADYTFIAVGSPGQEVLAACVGSMGGARGVGICAGASIDFLTGTQRRAPRLLRRLALEWAYRLWMEPRRLAHRYFIESPKGLLFVLGQAFQTYGGGTTQGRPKPISMEQQ